jgi:hypothetical protein
MSENPLQDEVWKRNFRDALDQQTKQIDKLLEDLQEEKQARIGVAPKQEKQAVHTPQDQQPVIQTDESSYRVSFTKTGIEVSALLTDLVSANELISALNAFITIADHSEHQMSRGRKR